MRTTIDAAGRIVVPKALRDELGLGEGQEIEISARDGRLEVDVPATPMHLERRGPAIVAVPERPLPPLTAEQVRATLERTRR
jgi:AbrB family looped-hinge helix DNA binding protein